MLYPLLLLLLLTLPAWAMHHPTRTDPLAWVDHYTGAWGQKCCGVEDCQETTVAFLGHTTDGRCELLIGEAVVVVPCERVHPSETSQGVVCRMQRGIPGLSATTIRCVFYAESM